MYYIVHYIIGASQRYELKDILKDRYNIECLQTFDGVGEYEGRVNYVIDVPEIHPCFDEIQSLLPKPASPDIREGPKEFVYIYNYPVYSKEELWNARWLKVRCTNRKIEPLNWSETGLGSCDSKRPKSNLYSPYRHHYRGDTRYILKKAQNWKGKFFLADHLDEYIIFCSSATRELLENAGMKGIIYEPVYRKSENDILEDIYELKASYTIPNDAIVSLEGKDKMESYVCEECGMHMLGIVDTRGRYALLQNKIDADVDFCVTLPMFYVSEGDGNPSGGFYHLLISQRMYRFLKESHMDRGLFFEAIDVIE